ncbi:MAG: NYN domain-containing protein [Roseiflexaceae bacterium]|nr:NYN domain-containing protein [Roseiflexus sp.]MDW8213004.1 NYN domain-containing protein [Roseiflexaceae bacterium]
MATDNPRLDVAVFIDFENVYVSVRDKLDVNPNFEIIMDRVADLGRVVIARAYADWYRYPRVTSALYANGIEPMYVPTYYYDRDLGRTGRAIKNSVDMNLCIDAMKTLYTNPNIAKFVLATGDRDFIPLVNAIRQHGKEVIIIGVGGAASGHLAQSADEFIFYEQLLGKKPQPLQADIPRIRTTDRGRDIEDVVEPAPSVRMRQEPQPAERTPPEPPAPEPPRDEPDIYDMLVRAVHLARERGYVCSFGSLKLIMKELMGGEFKESKYRDSTGKPFAKFKDFALEAERRGKVQVFTSGAIVEVFLPGEDPYKLSQFAQDLKEEPPVSTPETPIHVDAHIDGRPVSTGRRRRRRRGGASRPTTAPETTMAQPQDYVLHEDVTDELMAEALHDAVNGETAAADVVFEELLDRLEAERERQAALASLEMRLEDVSPALDELPDLEEEPDLTAQSGDLTDEAVLEAPDLADQMIIIDTPVEPPESFEAPESPASETTAPVAETRPFTNAEWQMLRDVVASAGRPLSFAQIHDLLREARNNASIFRTNEELRSLIKQAINTGVLRRSGKGARVVYHLAPQETLESAEASQAPAEGTPAAAPEPASEASVVMYAVETEIVVMSDVPAPATEPASPETAVAETPASDMSTAVDATAGTAEETTPGAATPAAAEEAVAPVAAESVTIGGIEVQTVAEEEPAAMGDVPQGMTVAGASEEAETMASAESALADATVADQPKPRRRRTVSRTKTSASETTEETASAARPKRSRSKAAVAASTEEAPRSTRRRKKVEVTEDSSQKS